VATDLSLDRLILQHLLYSDGYAWKVLPYLKPEYFSDPSERKIFERTAAYMEKYKARPTAAALTIEFEQAKDIPEGVYANIQTLLPTITTPPEAPADQWLIDSTEKFCSERAVYNAIMDGISILDGKDKKNRDKGAIPGILQEALSVSFDTHIGHDFIEHADERWNYYHCTEEKIPFDIDILNKITKGGPSKKTLNIIMASTGVGKTAVMCHMAAANLMLGKSVLYITMEMREEEIAKRIDANLLDVTIEELLALSKNEYDRKFSKLKKKTNGKLVVKEYPTATPHVGHFRHLTNELYLKKDFKPDIIYIDYMNICASSRVKMGSTVNSYTFVKHISEEFRGFAIEKGVPVITATQTNRAGFNNSDPELTETSESIGGPATADLWLALISTEELDACNHIMVKQLKNRYADLNKYKRFIVGFNKAKMRLFDVVDPTNGIINETPSKKENMPLFDKSSFGERMGEEAGLPWIEKRQRNRDFSDLKI